MGPRYNPYSRKSTPIQWGVSNGPHVLHDTRLPHDIGRPRPRVRGTAPEHAPTPSVGAGHASGRGTPGTSSGSSGTSCLRPTPVGSPTSEHDLSRSRRTGAPQLLAYSRGNRDVALQIAADPNRRELAIQGLESKRYAPSARNCRAARSSLWEDVVTTANLGDPLRPDAQMVFGAVAILQASQRARTRSSSRTPRGSALAGSIRHNSHLVASEGSGNVLGGTERSHAHA
jgi:hypothetical protein